MQAQLEELDHRVSVMKQSFSMGKLTLKELVEYKAYLKTLDSRLDISPHIDELKEVRDHILRELDDFENVSKESIEKAEYSVKELHSIIKDIEDAKNKACCGFKSSSSESSTSSIPIWVVVVIVILILIVIILVMRKPSTSYTSIPKTSSIFSSPY